jgi:hypothetical protein
VKYLTKSDNAILKYSNDLAIFLSAVASAQDLVAGLAFSLHVLIDLTISLNMEVFMETNLFTVIDAVKSECASLWGI